MIEKIGQNKAIDQLFGYKQLDLAYGRFVSAYPFALLASVLVVTALWLLVAHNVLLCWLVALWSVMLTRNYFVRRYLNISDKENIDSRKWEAGLVIGAIASGLCWGSTIYCFSSSPFDTPSILSIFVLSGVSAFATVEMASAPKAAISFMLSVLLPLAIWMFSFGERVQAIMGLLLLVYIGFLFMMMRQMNRMIVATLSSTEQNLSLSTTVQETNQRMSHFFESAPGFFYTATLHPDGTTSMPFTSSGIADLLGMTSEVVTENIAPILSIAHPEDVPIFLAAREESLRSLSPFRIEFRVKHEKKGWRWIELRSLPQRGQDGSTSWHGFMHDVTERKRMEEALVAREHESRTLIENSPDNISRYNHECRRVFVNPTFSAMVAGGEAALLGKTPTEFPGGVNAEAYEKKIAEVLVSGENAEYELKWSGQDGREVCSHVRLTAERDAHGTVLSVLAVGRDFTDINAYRQKIHQMAFFDTLTSLPNRASFNESLRQMLQDASKQGQQAGVMLLDLDRFKAINDTMGHPAGDELLREAAVRLTHAVRTYDTVARLGGDEFAILLPEMRSSADLGRIAGKVLEAFRAPFVLEGKEVFISTSVGIAVYPDDSSDVDDLIKQADSAMYFAKRSGRNNFRYYSKELTASARERLTLESELRRAVERNELELYFQPKVWLADGALVGSEALLRWNHPQRGMVPPDLFISIAEDSGLIVSIGEWVLHEACLTAFDWNGDNMPLHKVAINLSARQFQTDDLVKTVSRALEETGCQPEWIELEITESMLLDEHGEVLEILNVFQSMGIAIAIDDFGTGYSALSYLARYPINTLKIDRSFVSTLTEDKHRAELVKAIISIANSLGQFVVAEGVDNAEQAVFLHLLGCQIAQGYYYSKPMSRNAFKSLLWSFRAAPDMEKTGRWHKHISRINP